MTTDNSQSGNGDGEATVSGLHESAIDPADIKQLRAACRLHSLDVENASALPTDWVTPGLAPAAIHPVELEIGVPNSLKLRIVPLPRKAKVRRLKVEFPRPRINRGLAQMLAEPVTRYQLLMGELSTGQHKTLFKKVYEKYGEQADRLHVSAVFAHIPPEAAQSIELAPDLRSLRFTLPADVSPRGVKEGYYLVVLHGDPGETRNLLIRL